MVWNALPDDLRAQQDYESFRQGLKTWGPIYKISYDLSYDYRKFIEKLLIHCKMFCKLDVRRKLIVTLALS